MRFERYHGVGNDYLVWDSIQWNWMADEKQIELICNRNFGLGSDGILYGPIFDGKEIKVRIFNPDGSEAEKSGNGVRIFSKFLKDFKYVESSSYELSTIGGKVRVDYLSSDGSLMKVLMGKTTCNSKEIPATGPERDIIDETMFVDREAYQVTCVNIGNPHCVILMDDISKDKAVQLGKVVETSKNFPQRINMQLLKIIDRNNIQIEIYERGAGYTLASGSSSCAAATAAFRLGLVNEKITVHMPGGNLAVEIKSDSSVYMTGTVNRIGTIITSTEFDDSIGLI